MLNKICKGICFLFIMGSLLYPSFVGAETLNTQEKKPMDEKLGPFDRGEPNDAYARYFTGQSYLNMLTKDGVAIGNVTFEPACRNNWHIPHADKGGGQILLCTAGRGWYQEWGKEPRAA